MATWMYDLGLTFGDIWAESKKDEHSEKSTLLAIGYCTKEMIMGAFMIATSGPILLLGYFGITAGVATLSDQVGACSLCHKDSGETLSRLNKWGVPKAVGAVRAKLTPAVLETLVLYDTWGDLIRMSLDRKARPLAMVMFPDLVRQGISPFVVLAVAIQHPKYAILTELVKNEFFLPSFATQNL